jgi:hypothetical protein
MKNERKFKNRDKNVQPSVNLKELKQDINSKCHTVTNICNVRRKIIRQLLATFLVKLKPATNNKDIYEKIFYCNTK